VSRGQGRAFRCRDARKSTKSLTSARSASESAARRVSVGLSSPRRASSSASRDAEIPHSPSRSLTNGIPVSSDTRSTSAGAGRARPGKPGGIQERLHMPRLTAALEPRGEPAERLEEGPQGASNRSWPTHSIVSGAGAPAGGMWRSDCNLPAQIKAERPAHPPPRSREARTRRIAVSTARPMRASSSGSLKTHVRPADPS
jgi:hypothetical protein